MISTSTAAALTLVTPSRKSTHFRLDRIIGSTPIDRGKRALHKEPCGIAMESGFVANEWPNETLNAEWVLKHFGPGEYTAKWIGQNESGGRQSYGCSSVFTVFDPAKPLRQEEAAYSPSSAPAPAPAQAQAPMPTNNAPALEALNMALKIQDAIQSRADAATERDRIFVQGMTNLALNKPQEPQGLSVALGQIAQTLQSIAATQQQLAQGHAQLAARLEAIENYEGEDSSDEDDEDDLSLSEGIKRDTSKLIRAGIPMVLNHFAQSMSDKEQAAQTPVPAAPPPAAQPPAGALTGTEAA